MIGALANLQEGLQDQAVGMCLQSLPRGRGKAAREPRALAGNLWPHLLGVLRLNPAAQVIRQRGVHPIAACA